MNEVAKEGSWCGYFELAAMAVTMNRPIVIAHAAGNFHCFNSEGSLEPIALFYNAKITIKPMLVKFLLIFLH